MGKKKTTALVPTATAGVVVAQRGQHYKLNYKTFAEPPQRATEMTIQSNEHETVLSFFAVDVPPPFGVQPSTLDANCVARIVLPTSKLASFAAALRTGHVSVPPTVSSNS